MCRSMRSSYARISSVLDKAEKTLKHQGPTDESLVTTPAMHPSPRGLYMHVHRCELTQVQVVDCGIALFAYSLRQMPSYLCIRT